MFHFTAHPAIIQMLDPTKGDLFAVVAEKSQYVVRVEQPLTDANHTVGKFMPGTIGLTEDGQPALISLRPNATFTLCKPLSCTVKCGICEGVMRPAGEVFVCTGCGSME